MGTLVLKRRNYLDRVAYAIGQRCPMDWNNPRDRSLLRIYAVLALSVGTNVSIENVHDAWSAWTAELDPDHSSLVPFNDLPEEVQELDREYAQAIKDVVWWVDSARRNDRR